MLPWVGPILRCHITVKELAPIVVAAALWCKSWRGKLVGVRCDNSAVVNIINQGTSRSPEAMHLMRCLAHLAARGEFRLREVHVRGSDNVLADAISRNNVALFHFYIHRQA